MVVTTVLWNWFFNDMTDILSRYESITLDEMKSILYSIAERKHWEILAVEVMPDHVHLFVRPVKRSAFAAFLRDLQCRFSFTYNKEYGHKGPLMMPSGYAPKTSRKSINSCLIYIFNNPVEGGMIKRAVEYKWNLLAYSTCDHPFSERLVKRDSRSRMRRVLEYVDYCFEKDTYLDYSLQNRIFNPLTPMEKKQIIDYIVCKYNPVPKDILTSRFGSYENAVIAIDSFKGSESLAAVERTFVPSVSKTGIMRN